MKKHTVILVFFVALMVNTLNAQIKTWRADVGASIGTNTVVGDIVEPNYPNSLRPSIGGMIRLCPNDRIAYRGMVEYGMLYGSGKVEVPTFLVDHAYGFSKNFISGTALFEVNYKNYRVRNSKMKFSPFIGFGLGVDYFFSNGHGFNPDTGDLNGGGIPGMIENPIWLSDPGSELGVSRYVDVEESFPTLTIPVVFGVKYNVGKWWSMSAEVYAKKLFSDKVDNLDDPYQYFNNGGSLSSTSGSHNNDWIFGGRICIYMQVYHGCRMCPDYN